MPRDAESFEVRPTVAEDLAPLAADAVPEDVAQLAELVRMTPLQAAQILARRSEGCCWTWHEADPAAGGAVRPAAMFGVVHPRLYWPVGDPWLVPSNLLRRRWRRFVRGSRVFLPCLTAHYPELKGLVDVDNRRSLRWLTWLGFAVDAPAPSALYSVIRLRRADDDQDHRADGLATLGGPDRVRL